jgi:hypothetical protein
MLEITANQLFAHVVGDYLLQSDWMATEKVKANTAAFSHAFAYTVPFVWLAPSSWTALFIIYISHFVVDRFRLAKYVCYLKNFLAPSQYWYAWEDCDQTGYHKDRPLWLAVWLMIIADNAMHVFFNAVALQCFG